MSIGRQPASVACDVTQAPRSERVSSSAGLVSVLLRNAFRVHGDKRINISVFRLQCFVWRYVHAQHRLRRLHHFHNPLLALLILFQNTWIRQIT